MGNCGNLFFCPQCLEGKRGCTEHYSSFNKLRTVDAFSLGGLLLRVSLVGIAYLENIF